MRRSDPILRIECRSDRCRNARQAAHRPGLCKARSQAGAQTDYDLECDCIQAAFLAMLCRYRPNHRGGRKKGLVRAALCRVCDKEHLATVARLERALIVLASPRTGLSRSCGTFHFEGEPLKAVEEGRLVIPIDIIGIPESRFANARPVAKTPQPCRRRRIDLFPAAVAEKRNGVPLHICAQALCAGFIVDGEPEQLERTKDLAHLSLKRRLCPADLCGGVLSAPARKFILVPRNNSRPDD